MKECFYCDCHTQPYVMNKRYRKAPSNGQSIDHKIPTSRGGAPDDPDNRVHSCVKCNSDKGNLTVEEYRVVIAFREGKLNPVNIIFPGEL
jgi:5-methylcytosine-specific restriction endonuclease McrA